VFLALTGQHAFHTFWGTVLAQGVLGVLGQLLVYRILTPAGPRLALACGTVYALSLLPFLAAKLMLSEQLFTFLVLATVYALGSYYRRRRPEWMYATVACGLLAMFTRWEGVIVLVTAGVALIAARQRAHVRHLLACAVLIVATLTGWSAVRAAIIGDWTVFGTLQNSTGDQVFYRVYRSLPAYVGLSAVRRIDGEDGPSMSALVSDDSPEGVVEELWSGATCIAR